MPPAGSAREDLFALLALGLPLAARFHADDAQSAVQRLVLLLVALGVAYAWAVLFARTAGRAVGPGLPAFAVTFVLMLPGPVGVGAAALALSFGAVFGREIFGARAILPPALIALAFAIFSFPAGGFETRGVLAAAPDPLFAASCLAGGAILLARGLLAFEVAAGAAVGATITAWLMGSPAVWEHLVHGAFAAGVVFLAAAPESAANAKGARWLHGILVGGLVVLIRLATPGEPDGVVFAALMGGLFAPLLERTLGWRPRRA